MLTLIVGLGNPGDRYEGTRHNVGFDILDLLVERRGARWQFEGKFNGWVTRTNFGSVEGPGLPVWFLKPSTYMNASGEAVSAFFQWHKMGPSSLLAVVDDVALPVGQLRFRSGGSAGGHNGLLSLDQRLRTREFARLRCGVGSPMPEEDLADYVLRRPPKEERAVYQSMISRAAEAVEVAVLHGLEPAMNQYNRDPQAAEKKAAVKSAPPQIKPADPARSASPTKE